VTVHISCFKPLWLQWGLVILVLAGWKEQLTKSASHQLIQEQVCTSFRLDFKRVKILYGSLENDWPSTIHEHGLLHHWALPMTVSITPNLHRILGRFSWSRKRWPLLYLNKRINAPNLFAETMYIAPVILFSINSRKCQKSKQNTLIIRLRLMMKY
jgi:hypothetical protein